MRAHPLGAIAALAIACAFFALGCLQSPEPTQELEPSAPERSSDTEPTEEARQPFGSKAFPFVVVVQEDGEDQAGGWQKAVASLHFVHLHWGIPTHHWQCPLAVGMPLRSRKEGHISPSRAALLSAEIATDVANALLPSQDWEGETAVFCIKLEQEMQQLFRGRYPGVGARVTRA